MTKELQGKNILITGAAKGIGSGIALNAASKGANIAVHYLGSEEEALRTAKDIRELGVNAITVKGDIAIYNDVQQMKVQLDKDFGHIDGLVNNAGWAQMKSFFKYKPEEWQREIDVCFNGVLNLAYTFVPSMKDKKQGKFINIVGDSARTGDRHLIVSGAARNGTIGFMKSLAREVGNDNIQCNTASLGLIDQGTFDFDDETMNKIVKQYPLKKLGSVNDVAETILFLLSDDSDWITGQVISVNGGHSMLG
ncbi:SDR family NAD(P)-dependent oxidoreductase [Lentibacillus sp. CBA3610]|uniref:SDR family NAD(P)-dependent oxidoreductase n=1 Tax=Lentibacillus sp. CBA3610 TaxID=2518176 RepID=UPI0015953CCC|nr:SDR family oxidoreductase [Lentibacillus sp. CBA3610]